MPWSATHHAPLLAMQQYVSMEIDFAALERFAVANARPTLALARGTCLHAALELAAEAKRLGLAEHACMVRWRLRDDPAYLEHWALRLDDGRVLDTTAVQVDGDARVVRRVSEYPAQLGRPRRYPIDTVFEAVGHPATAAGDRFSRRSIWRLHGRLFRHDARKALRAIAPRELLGAVGALLKCAYALAVSRLLESATTRADALMRRAL